MAGRGFLASALVQTTLKSPTLKSPPLGRMHAGLQIWPTLPPRFAVPCSKILQGCLEGSPSSSQAQALAWGY